MKKKSLKTKILERLKEMNCWVHKSAIESRAKEWGFLGDNAGRRCREMAEIGILESKIEKGTVYYKYKGVEKIIIKPVIQDNGTVRLIEQKVLI